MTLVVALAIAGLPFFLPLGILSGASSLIPYAGPLVVGASITLLTLVTGGLWKAVSVAVYFILYGKLEGNVLGPLVYRRTVHVNPLVTLLAILFLAEFMGVMGAPSSPSQRPRPRRAWCASYWACGGAADGGRRDPSGPELVALAHSGSAGRPRAATRNRA